MKPCVVSHDAGGAEILAAWVAREQPDCTLVLEGPALRVFERRLGRLRLSSLDEALAASDWCLCGTGWQSDLEWRAIGAARRLGKRCVAFLDYWANYEQRFVRNGVRLLPDELWAGDEEAVALARAVFPGTPVRLVPNPYFAEALADIARHAGNPAPARAGLEALFVCENISGHAQLRYGDARHWGYTELDAIDFFLGRLQSLGTPVARVVIRPHPSDPPGKYAALAARDARIAPSDGRPLLEEIAQADLVVGCEGTALVLAHAAGKRVISAIPPGGRAQFIDRRTGIQMLRNL